MIKLLTIIGARPQIIKAAALSRAIEKGFKQKLVEVILHTGQHYDDSMSDIFFREMQIPQPDYNLKIGSASHGSQTGQMIEGIEEVILKERPKRSGGVWRYQFHPGRSTCCCQAAHPCDPYRSRTALVQQTYARGDQPHCM